MPESDATFHVVYEQHVLWRTLWAIAEKQEEAKKCEEKAVKEAVTKCEASEEGL